MGINSVYKSPLSNKKKPDTSYIVERCNGKGAIQTCKHMRAWTATLSLPTLTWSPVITFQMKQEIGNTRGHKKGSAALDGTMLELP